MPGGSRSGGPFFAGSEVSVKKRSMLNIIADIQRIHLVEKLGIVLPPEAFTLETQFAYVEVGIHAVVLDGLMSLLGMPCFFAVLSGTMPIFGQWDPGLLDILVALILGGGYGFWYSLMLARELGPCYFGSVSERAIDTIFSALRWSSVVKVLLLFIAFHGLHHAISPESVHQVFETLWPLLSPVMSDRSAVMVQDWMINLREILVISSWAVLWIALIEMALPALYCWLGFRLAAEEYRLNVIYDGH